jgi:23S rRNA (adenine2503-C2)-methyltransferase
MCKNSEFTLAGLPLEELTNLLSPLPAFRAVQIFKWISRGVLDFDGMTDIPISLREEMKSRFPISSCAITGFKDGKNAKKIVLALKDGAQIEAVLLRDGADRLTACLSTQAGCPGGCVFCKTGSIGFLRNLTAAEIVEQLLLLNYPETDGKDRRGIGNIVFMGMGEPLLNMAHLRKAIEVVTDPAGLHFSRRKITVSTCGISAGLFDIAEHGPFTRLALSLTSADERLRHKLMPITEGNPLQKVKEALVLFQRKGGGRITLEAALLGGINTRSEDAASIAEFAQGLDTVINLIPWNPVDGLHFEGKPLTEPDGKEIENFKRMLVKRGLKVTLRLRKGRGVTGACGQLGNTQNAGLSLPTSHKNPPETTR